MKQKPTHKEEVLTTLKETLVNAISTIDRLQCDNNPVMDRNQEMKTIDSWYVQLTEDNRIVAKNWDGNENWHYKVGSYVGVNKSGMKNGIYDLKWAVRFDRLISTEEFYNKIGYTKHEENILQKGKEVFNSQNEIYLNIGDNVTIIVDSEVKGIISSIDDTDRPTKYFVRWKTAMVANGYFSASQLKLFIDPKKEVLFTTLDGVDLYEGGECCYVNKKTFDKGRYFGLDKNILDAGDFNDYVHFSTREKSAEYILMNKPLLSLNDLLGVWSGQVDNEASYMKDYHSTSPMFQKFKKLAEEKLK